MVVDADRTPHLHRSEDRLVIVQRELRGAIAALEDARNADLATIDGRGYKARRTGHAGAAIRRALYRLTSGAAA
jgi:hypothetical protein